MEEENLRPSEDQLMDREEKCRKAIRTLVRALMMRVAVTVLLALALTGAAASALALGLLAFVLVITLAGALPLVTELKKQRGLLREILEQYE